MCTLMSELTIECEPGLTARDNQVRDTTTCTGMHTCTLSTHTRTLARSHTHARHMQCKSSELSKTILGVGIGLAFALCVVLLLVYIRRNPSSAKRILKSFMNKEAKMVAVILAEVRPLCTHRY